MAFKKETLQVALQFKAVSVHISIFAQIGCFCTYKAVPGKLPNSFDAYWVAEIEIEAFSSKPELFQFQLNDARIGFH